MNICNYITNYLIKKNIILSEDKEIYLYGLFVIFYNSFLIFNILLIGFVYQQLEYSFLFLIFWSPYRILVGGSHCSTPFKCWLFFNLYYLIGYYIYLHSTSIIYIINTLAIIIQYKKNKNNFFFIILWIIYYVLLFVMPLKYQLILSIAYLLNSLLTIHQIISNKEFII